MLNITKRERKTNDWIRQQTKVQDIIYETAKKKWKWSGHLARIKDQRWSIQVLNWTPREEKRPRRRPKRRWKDDIVTYMGTTWQRKAQNRQLWKDSEETFIQQ